MLTRFAALIFLFIIIPSSSFSGVTKDDIKNSIKREKLHHPYLYFNEQEKTVIQHRIKNDPESKEIMDRLLAEANRFLFTPVEKQAPVQQRNPRYWSDGKAIQYVGLNRRAAQILAFVYQMTGEKKYAEKAFQFADVLCDLPSWVYRAHEFPIIHSRVWPWSVPDNQAVFNFDIRTGDIACELAAVYDWLYPALNKRQKDRIRGALLEKAILLVQGNYDYHWWATAYRCNWCGICFSGLGVASIALLTEDPSLVDVVAESYNRMSKMFDEIGIDGGWQEGRGYWAYGMRSCVLFMESLKRITDNRYNLFEHPRVKQNPATFALFGITAYFGDGSGKIVGSTHLLNKLTDETKDGLAAWYRENMLGNGQNMFDIIWPRSIVQPIEPTQKSKHFRSIDWVVMRSDFFNPENVTVACKAGYNTDPHHGHLDCGQFIINWRNQAYIRDLGSAKYDEKYFDEVRWDYPQASSAGHNLVFVNDELQISAKYKNQPWNENIGGKILTFRTTKNRDYTLLDASKAYPGKELKKWRRHIILEKPVITILLDEITCNKGAEIETRFHPGVATEIKDRYVLLTGETGILALLPVVDGDYYFREGKHADLPVQKEAVFNWIPYFGTVLRATKANTRIITIILPVENENEAGSIANSIIKEKDSQGNIVLSFEKKNKTYRYNFKSENEELVLAK